MLAKKYPTFSVIIPVKRINSQLTKETIPKILEQSYRDFEVIILPDKKVSRGFAKTRIIPTFSKSGPAQKRDIGAKKKLQ